MALTKSNHFKTPQVIQCITMELSANRRYTSKLVLEDTQLSFRRQKEKGQKKLKAYMPHWERQGPERSPQRRSVMRGRSQESQLTSSQSPCPWRISLRFYVQSFPAPLSSALLGPPVSRWVLSAVSWLVNYTWRQRNRRGPGGPRNSRHRSEADWKLRRNFNCTTGNAVITSIIFIALPLVLPYWEDGFT